VDACQGYDLPPFIKFNDIKTWDEQAPPKGALSHYVNKGDQEVIVPCAPAPSLGVRKNRGFYPQLNGSVG
jgi:hypothetical protein